MTERVPLGWRVPEDVWAGFETYVAKKHGDTDAYLRFELEYAVREFLDEDNILAEAEDLLQTHTDLRGLSSSTAVGIGTDRYRGTDTKKLGHRVSLELRERFAIFADKHDASSYGRLLASALDAYTDGGRTQRILEDVERLVTGDNGGTTGDTTDAAIESTAGETTHSDSTDGTVESTLSTAGGSGITADTSPEDVDVEARFGLGVAKELPVVEAFAGTILPKTVLDEAIEDVVGADSEAIFEPYREPVLDQLNAPHPHLVDRYITEAYRESHLIYDDMDGGECEVFLRRFAAEDAVERRQRRVCFAYQEVRGLFEEKAGGEKPSVQYAYDLMEWAADEPGFEYDEFHGSKQLRVTLDDVSDAILEYAFDEIPVYRCAISG